MDHTIFQQLRFHPATTRWFAQTFKEPSPPQRLGWPNIADDQHTLILAPTGSGKTLAAFLWCIDDVFRHGLATDASEFARNAAGVHTLYISPLKALNNDIHHNLQEPLKGIRRAAEELDIPAPPIRTAVRTGDTPSHVRQSMVKTPPHILITTPESLYLLITSERGRNIFSQLRYIIVDEIHAVSNNKRGVHLSVSLERLMPLCKKEPVRIGLSATQKPLERVAEFLGGRQPSGTNTMQTRPVSIVDAGQRKDMNLRVISPVKDFTDLPDATVWPMVIDKLYDLITSHRTTLVFVNMRAQTEKVARLLNEKHRNHTGDPDAELILAHHGSISREMRYDIEARLKRGDIPAVVATASLELGIDIGSIDLVVQLQSPKTVTSALQRVGRSGHLLSSTSKGILIPLYQADLDDVMTITQAMLDGNIEETSIPENCLDVLSQHIVAEVAMQSWNRADLFRLIKQSYCFRHLSEPVFDNVVDMLSGRFGSTDIRALQPRITWDKVNDQLIARRGSRLLAVMNGGTIADRGYYGVYLRDANTRLGEVEEEFVFESKVGDIFFLGNNEWRIDEITRDRIVVTPRGSVKPRAPFWKAEPMFRDFSTSARIGAFRRDMLKTVQDQGWSNSIGFADEDSQQNLYTYFARQLDHSGQLPTDRDIVIEYFRDTVGEPHFLIHAPFGGRVLGAWATALATALEKQFSVQVQFTYDDDGMLFRLLDAEEPPPFDQLLKLPFIDLEQYLMEAISQTPMFIVRFRHNATRALLLQRSRLDKRIPLWLQRLRAADLLQVVREFPDFPILLETYRDCLKDLFDINSLKTVTEQIQTNHIRLHVVHTPSPSPMTSGLMFRFLSEQMYDYDHHRAAGQAAEVSSELLADILARETIPAIVSRELVEKNEQYWQYLSPERQAKDAEDVFEIINKLGPLPTKDVADRCKIELEPMLEQLADQNRIQHVNDPVTGWATPEWVQLYNKDDANALVLRFLQHHGPVTIRDVVSELPLAKHNISDALDELRRQKAVVQGQLIEDSQEDCICERDNFASLYRQAISERRRAHDPGTRSVFFKFLSRWHHLADARQEWEALYERYAGYWFPLYLFERDILGARLCKNIQESHDSFAIMREQIQSGQIIAAGRQDTDGGRNAVCFIPRGKGGILFDSDVLHTRLQQLDEQPKTVAQFLKENGSSLHQDIHAGTGLTSSQVDEALTILVKNGLASCDHYASFLAALARKTPPEQRTQPWQQSVRQPWMRAQPQGRRQRPSRLDVQSRIQHRQGRWFLLTSFAVMGKPVEATKRAELQARLLLQRYGIVVKEFYRREHGLVPWYHIFRVLKRMEWSGEIRRGYFIEGLSGLQFASIEAVRLLEDIQQHPGAASTALLSTLDPALPFGGQIDWEFRDQTGQKITVIRSAGNHVFLIDDQPAAYLEQFGARIRLLQQSVRGLAAQIKFWMHQQEPIRPKRNIEIQSIDGKPAAHHSLAEEFISMGFEIDSDSLVLWPSGV